MNKILLDTCALIWLILGEDTKLGEDARSIIEDDAVEKLVSPVSFLEIATKSCLPKYKEKGEELLTREEFKASIMEIVEFYDLQLLDLKLDHAEYLYDLVYEKDHKDPFDRIIVAKALTEGAALVSSDGKLYYYGFSEQYKNVWTQPVFGE